MTERNNTFFQTSEPNLKAVKALIQERQESGYFEETLVSLAETQPPLLDMVNSVTTNAHHPAQYTLGVSLAGALGVHKSANRISLYEVERYRMYTWKELEREYRDLYLKTLHSEDLDFDTFDFYPRTMFLQGYHPSAFITWFQKVIRAESPSFAEIIDRQSMDIKEEAKIKLLYNQKEPIPGDKLEQALEERANTFRRGMFDILIPTAVAFSGLRTQEYFREVAGQG